MPFEEFKEKKVQSREPHVSILKSGNVSMNSACYNQYFKDFTYIVFFFDRERNVIGIRPVRQSLPNSYTIRKNRETGSGGNVAANAFLKKMVGLDYEKHGTKSYNVTWNEAEKLLEVDLNSPKE